MVHRPYTVRTLTSWGFVPQLVLLWIVPFIIFGLALTKTLSPNSVAASQGIQFDAPPKQVDDFETTNVRVGTPTRIVVPRLDIDVSVLPGVFDSASATWTISDGAAYFATMTTPVNDSEGTTLIYGHNIWQVFGALEYADAQTTVLVYTDTDLIFEYTFMTSEDVKPNDVSVLYASGDPQLVLQTCSGRWNEKRTLFTFALKSVKNT